MKQQLFWGLIVLILKLDLEWWEVSSENETVREFSTGYLPFGSYMRHFFLFLLLVIKMFQISMHSQELLDALMN